MAVIAAVKQRSSGICEWCGRTRVPEQMEPHHVIFRGQGGKHVVENLLHICWHCHYGPKRPDVDMETRYAMERLMASHYGLTLAEWKLVATGKKESSFHDQ